MTRNGDKRTIRRGGVRRVERMVRWSADGTLIPRPRRLVPGSDSSILYPPGRRFADNTSYQNSPQRRGRRNRG